MWVCGIHEAHTTGPCYSEASPPSARHLLGSLLFHLDQLKSDLQGMMGKTHLVKCLPHEHKSLSWDPQYEKKTKRKQQESRLTEYAHL